MMKVWAFLLVIALVNAKHEQYSGWKSYYIGVATSGHYNMLKNLEDKYQLEILGPPILGREGIVLVKPAIDEVFIKALDAAGISHRIHVDDIQRQLQREDAELKNHRENATAKCGGRSLPYDSYQDIEAIEDYIDYIGETYPNVTTVVEAAESFEGRPIKYLKISTTNFKDLRKPVIYIDAGTHAREWISIPVATWAIRKLVEDVTENDLLDRFDWIILPVVNPDGYKHSYLNDRFWRKSRSTDQHELSNLCPGVDINRNYDFSWNTVGVSNNPCSDIFCGSAPFSEVETRVVRDILLENMDRMALYLTMHSFGSVIIYSWCDDGSYSNHAPELYSVGSAMAKEIDRHSLPNFPRYSAGNAAFILNYLTSGTSLDYAHSIGVALCFGYELPGPKYGFNLDPNLIEQVCRETWAGITVGARKAGEVFNYRLRQRKTKSM